MQSFRVFPVLLSVSLIGLLAFSQATNARVQQSPQNKPPVAPAPNPAGTPAAPVREGAQEKPTDKPKADQEKKDKRADAKDDKQPDMPANDAEVIKIDTTSVQLDVFVIDQNNTPILSLTKDDFTVFEDKVKQPIDDVSITEVPLSFGMVIDTSGSMRSKLQTVTDAALGLIKSMQTDDEAFVASFKAEPELIQDFTPDKRELEEALGNLYTSSGTALLDAIIATADYAQEKGKSRRKAVIVITDGVEKNSAVKEKEVLEAIKEDEVQIYLVGFIDEEEMNGGIFGKSGGKRAKDLLQRIADDSGGRAFFPKDVSEMSAIAKQIAKDLRTQYVVNYYPTNEAQDGSFRQVKVQVQTKDGRRLIARTRQGYYAGKGGEPPPPALPEKKRN